MSGLLTGRPLTRGARCLPLDGGESSRAVGEEVDGPAVGVAGRGQHVMGGVGRGRHAT